MPAFSNNYCLLILINFHILFILYHKQMFVTREYFLARIGAKISCDAMLLNVQFYYNVKSDYLE